MIVMYDRTWQNEDGSTYYGVDDDNGKTDWYNEDGDLDSYSDTPSDDEQEMNDAGYF